MIGRPAALALLVGLLLASRPSPAAAQQLGPSTGGMAALDQARRFVGQQKRVLMIAAHPDDEDTELLTILARGLGAEAAYLSLTRGEGGQNLIGGELGPALGVLRSEELLAARALDGARQYFTRAYDFGFSKNLEDTWRFWPRDTVLKDVVRVIRTFRPQVVVSIFSGTPRDGHGQHQAAGWAAREAFAAAADPTRFPELERDLGLQPWRVAKLYQSARFDTAGASVVLEGGVLDPAVGQSYLQIAMRGRSLHRSQDMGAAQRIGPSAVRLRLLEDRTGTTGDGLFAGVDTTYAAPLGLGGVAGAEANGLQTVAGRAVREPMARADLVIARDQLARIAAARQSPEARDQVARMDEVLFRSSAVLCDATTSVERPVPGQEVLVSLQCWNASSRAVRVTTRLEAGIPGMTVAPRERPLAPGELFTDTVRVTVPTDAAPTAPYYLRAPRAGAIYTWPAGEDRALGGLPFEPPVLQAAFELSTGGAERREVVYRTVDQAVGEVRRPLSIVPPVSVTLQPGAGLWPAGPPRPHRFTVTLRHAAPEPTEVSVRLEVPQGWRVSPAQPVRFEQPGEERVLQFTVTPAARAMGRHAVLVALDQPGVTRLAQGTAVVAYAHIHPRQVLTPAEAIIEIAPFGLPGGGAIAYVRGAADRVPEALDVLGLAVTPLTGTTLGRTDLSRFTTIVIGPRAYETDPALAGQNDRLVEFARRGGTVLVQYQQEVYFRGGYAPYRLSLTAEGEESTFRVRAPRVAEEDAPVTVLDPAHPALRGPNRLQAGDWDGWVQERGLYFARSWGPEWTPLLEMNDRGEPPQRGGLLAARVGRGWYVYSGVSFFRQLPAAVPGATRLFLNLLALGRPRAGV
ncbi:MAG TPA: PIG-L family deacetylase [Gemmatimonadales bacterium]